MIYEQTYKIGMSDIGTNDGVSNYGLLSFMENLAISYSDTVGYGIKDIKTKNRAWLLMDWDLNVIHRPLFNEKVTVKTYAIQMEKPSFHSFRNFEVYDEKQNLVATASSKWILFDTLNHKICKLDMEFMHLYHPEKIDDSIEEKLKKLKEPDSYANMIEYQIKRFDIDAIGHMHNLNYLKIAYEALPEEIYLKNELKNVRIMYKHQVFLNSIVKCFYSKQEDGHYITIKNQDESKIHAIIKLY